jgi:RIO kinase 1
LNRDGSGKRNAPRGKQRGADPHTDAGSAQDDGRSARAGSAVPEAAPDPLPDDFAASVQVTETERAWIREHLGPFQQNQLITDVVQRIKAGKEATVYACTGHPSTGRAIIAAKLYRERSLRSSKNTGQYQQGRALLDEEGNDARPRAGRSGKEISQKTKRGQAIAQVSWLMHEFTLLKELHALGADVPEPIEHGSQALLMEFVGENTDAAPTLNDVQLDPSEAQRLRERVLFNVELLLELGWVHGDLSPYNLLYHQGRILLIDFPQVADCRNNPRAFVMFERDIERIVDYFASFGCKSDARELGQQLWAKHIGEPEDQ